MTLEEQTAKAIYEARNGPRAVPWNHQPKGHRDPYLADARAAIAIISPVALQLGESREEKAYERAAIVGYRICAETRHVTLGDKVFDAILALKDPTHEPL